jgi:hypothetical protein
MPPDAAVVAHVAAIINATVRKAAIKTALAVAALRPIIPLHNQ